MHARYGAQILLLSRSNSWICVAEIYYNQKKNNTTTNNNNSRKKLLLSPCLFFALAVLDGWNHNFVRKLWQKIEMKRRKRKSRVFSELRKQLLDRSSWLPKLRDFMTSQRGFKKRLSLLAETDSTMYVPTYVRKERHRQHLYDRRLLQPNSLLKKRKKKKSGVIFSDDVKIGKGEKCHNKPERKDPDLSSIQLQAQLLISSLICHASLHVYKMKVETQL